MVKYVTLGKSFIFPRLKFLNWGEQITLDVSIFSLEDFLVAFLSSSACMCGGGVCVHVDMCEHEHACTLNMKSQMY